MKIKYASYLAQVRIVNPPPLKTQIQLTSGNPYRKQTYLNPIVENKKLLCMKKLQALLHDDKVQGSLIVGVIFVAIAVILIVTAGK